MSAGGVFPVRLKAAGAYRIHFLLRPYDWLVIVALSQTHLFTTL